MESILFGFVAFAGVLGFIFFRKQKAKKGWKSVASQTDLTFRGGGFWGDFSMTGRFNSLDVTVETEKRGSGKHKKTYTVYQTSLPQQIPPEVDIYEEGIFSEVGKFFGGEDIEIGDTAFDDAFIVKGGPTDVIRECFSKSAIRDTLLGLHEKGYTPQIETGELHIEHRGLANSEEQLRNHLEALTDSCHAIREAVGAKTNDETTATNQSSSSDSSHTSLVGEEEAQDRATPQSGQSSEEAEVGSRLERADSKSKGKDTDKKSDCSDPFESDVEFEDPFDDSDESDWTEDL